MKWMGGWSWDDYNQAPIEVVDEIRGFIKEEQEELARIRAKG